jgi:hypothetical protein
MASADEMADQMCLMRVLARRAPGGPQSRARRGAGPRRSRLDGDQDESGRGLSRRPCANPCTNHMQKALSLFERGPLALVAGEGFEPSISGL